MNNTKKMKQVAFWGVVYMVGVFLSPDFSDITIYQFLGMILIVLSTGLICFNVGILTEREPKKSIHDIEAKE